MSSQPRIVQFDLHSVHLLIKTIRLEKFMNITSHDAESFLDFETHRKVLLLYAQIYSLTVSNSTTSLHEITTLLETCDSNILFILWILIMRYFFTDDTVNDDFEARFTRECNRSTSEQGLQNIQMNFKLFFNLISVAKQELFCETTPYYFDIITNARGNKLFCFGDSTTKYKHIFYVKHKKEEIKLRVENERKKKEEEALIKALEEAKPVKISKQSQTKQANKKREKTKKEREEYEKRSAIAEAERQRQIKKKQQQKQSKKAK